LISTDFLRWQDLGEYQFVAPTRDFKARMRRVLGAHAEPLLLQPGYETSYFTTAFGLVAAGLGVTLCPTYAKSLVQAYGLNMIPIQEPAFLREVCLYSQAAKALSPAASAFTACLQTVVAGEGFGAI
jgi:DNA-binding transcriptional LysR family regulator